MLELKCRSLAGWSSLFFFLSFFFYRSGGLISTDHFIIDMSGEKTKITNHVKQKGGSSVNFCRSQKVIAGWLGEKLAESSVRISVYRVGIYTGALRRVSINTPQWNISYLYSEQKWRKRSSSSCVLTHSAVETGPNCAVVFRSLRQTKCQLRAPISATVFGMKSGKREERVTR